MSEKKIRIVSYPQVIGTESLMEPSILLLGPVLGSSIDILEFTIKHIQKILEGDEFKNVRILKLVTTRYLEGDFKDVVEFEYNKWVTYMINEHAKRDLGRVVLVMIPRENGNGKVVNPVRGYARHTSFELGYLLGKNARLSAFIDSSFCEYRYYYDSTTGFKTGFQLHTDPLQAIQDALMMALRTSRVSKTGESAVEF